MTGGPRPRIEWPGGKAFAFTIFDDTDLTTLENGPPVYRFLTDLGFRITKSVWPLAPEGPGEVGGLTSADRDYLAWVRSLQAEGHEIGYHNATDGSSNRARTVEALDRFRELFGDDPACGANHSSNAEAIYWGPSRFSGMTAGLYNALTLGRYRHSFHGEDEETDWFWGDLCRERVRYWRNFTFTELNTLEPCPRLPYRDPDRPYVDHWFASTEASNSDKVTEQFTPAAIDRLEASGGACILYTHLGSGFWWEDALHPGFVEVMRDLAGRDGWFAPVGDVLDHLRSQRPDTVLTRGERAALERRWLWQRLRRRDPERAVTVRFTRVPLSAVPWEDLEQYPDRTVFQGQDWLSFLAASQGADPVVAAIDDGARQVGWFTGARVRRFGMGVLGSPLPGWTTSYQGFNLLGEDRPRDLLEGLARFASTGLGCRHVELMDRRLRPQDVTGPGWRTTTFPGWELDLAPEPDALLACTSASCRRDIRRAERNGLVVTEAPAAGFAGIYYDLLREVFTRRGATLTYPEARVQSLVDHLHPGGRLLLLTVREGDGPPIAAGIFPGGAGRAAYYWGGASRSAAKRLLPNEAMLWAAITTWRERGATAFDFGGGGSFKAKFGGTPFEVAWARHSRPAIIDHARGLAAAIARRHPR